MPKSSRSKGQWFMVSAVMVSAAFLVISSFLTSYSSMDSSKTATYNEDYYYNNVKEQFMKVVEQSDCGNLTSNLNEFKYFAEKSMGELGYLLFINYTVEPCPSKNVKLGMLLGSEKMVLYENVNPNDIIPGFD